MKNEKIIVAVDAMGGDHAPKEIIKGAMNAIENNEDIQVILVGKEGLLEKELMQHNYVSEQIEICNAAEVITTEEAPVVAIRKKRDSSMVVGLKLLREKKAHAFLSAGSTGALLAGGTLLVGRIKGVERPALAPLIPTQNGFSLLIDCGANVDSKPQYLNQFAKLGSLYFENVLGVPNPTVGLINIGTEKEKGNTLTKEAYPLLEDSRVNFIGNVEARDIPKGEADILVCDAFIGNILLKYTEGLGMMFLSVFKGIFMTNFMTKLCGAILKPYLKKSLKGFDYSTVGGAPLLGLEGLVVKAHGNSNAKAIENAILQCKKYTQANIQEKIKESI